MGQSAVLCTVGHISHRNTMVECLLMVRWVVGSIPHGGLAFNLIFLASCLQDLTFFFVSKNTSRILFSFFITERFVTFKTFP